MKVLVTGGAGFVGSRVVRKLLALGDHVVVVDDFSTGTMENLKGLDSDRLVIVREDIAKYALRPETSFDAVCHQAAVADVSESWKRPNEVYATNVTATFNLFDRLKHCGRFVFASSSAVYLWDDDHTLARENAVCLPSTPYGMGKLVAEAYVRHGGGIAMRYFNVYGPEQIATMTSRPVVASFLEALKRGERFTLDGGGCQVRDLVYVDDVAEANVMALHSEDPSLLRGRAFNIGTGVGTSVVTLANKVRDAYATVTGFRTGPAFDASVIGPRRPGDVAIAVADASYAHDRLGWSAKVSLDQGLAITVRDYLLQEQTA